MANLSNINNKFLVTTGGNVLIGQTSVIGSSIFQVTGDSTFTPISTVNFIVTNSGNALRLIAGLPSGATWVGKPVEYYASEYSFSTDVTGAGSYSQQLVIENNGDVGIGVSSPIKKLQVSSFVAGDLINILCVNRRDQNGDTASIGFSMTDNNLYNKAAVIFERTTTQGRGSLHFATNNVNSSANVGKADARMTILSNGDVGIGTTSPNARLDVTKDDGVASGLHVIADINQNAGAAAQMILGYYANGSATVGPLIYAANGMPQLINASGGINFSNDLGFSSNYMYTFRDGVGINNPNSQSAGGSAGYTMYVGRSSSGTVLGSISAKGTIRGSAFTSGTDTPAGIGASLGDVNAGELGPGYINLSRDDTAAAQQIRFEKNGVLHSYFETTTSGLNIGNANVGIGTTSPGAKLQVAAGNAQVQAWLGENSYTSAALRVGGNNGPGGRLYFQYDGDNSYIDSYGGHGSTPRYRDLTLAGRNLYFTTGNTSGSQKMIITTGGDIQIPTNSASIQLRSSGSGSYTSIRRDSANQLIVANTAGNQVFGIGNGGELAITNGASYSATYTYSNAWNSSYQTIIPGSQLSPNSVYIITINVGSGFGTPPYYASTVFHVATTPGTNSTGGGVGVIAPTATHVNSNAYWQYRLSCVASGRNGVEAQLVAGPTNPPSNPTISVKATKLMTIN